MKINSKILFERHGSTKVIRFDLKQGNELKAHTAPVNVLLIILNGMGSLSINGTETLLKPGDTNEIDANVLHAVKALTDFNFILIR